MTHVVNLESPFEERLVKLEESARLQIGRILKALEDNAFFEPDGEYLFARDANDQSCACAHSDGSWKDWKLVWYYEYSSAFPSITNAEVEAIVVTLVKEPFELQEIKPVSC